MRKLCHGYGVAQAGIVRRDSEHGGHGGNSVNDLKIRARGEQVVHTDKLKAGGFRDGGVAEQKAHGAAEYCDLCVGGLI